MDNVDFVKQEYFRDSIVMSELIRSMLVDSEVELSEDDITELLVWSGEEEYITAKEILNDVQNDKLAVEPTISISAGTRE